MRACVLASQSAFVVKVEKKSSTSSITKLSGPTIMQVAFWSVNCGLNSKPSCVKKSTDLSRSFTGRFTNILVLMAVPPSDRVVAFAG